MADRTVTVRLQASVSDYTAKLAAASRATTELANKVDMAKGRAATGYQTLGKGMLVAGGLIGAGVAFAVHRMAGFESRLAQVKALSGASANEMGKLRASALTVGTAFGISADEAADAEIELTKAGIGTADMLGGALKGALTLAAAGQIDVAQATEIAASAMTQFQLHGKDVPHIADLLAAGADRALGGVGDLGYALDQAGLQAKSFGISIEETVGTLSAFASAGLIGERGGTTFKQMLIQLASPSKQASAILSDLGINAYDASGQFVGMANLAGQLKNKMSGLTQAEKNHNLAVIFGSRAVLGANVLMQEGAEGIANWTNKVNVAGFAALQAAGKMDSLSGDMQKLKVAFDNALIGGGENANGPLRVMVQDITTLVNGWNDLPEPVKAGTELLIVAGGAALFVGGAFITLVPRIAETKLAMAELGLTSRGVATVMGKGGLFVGGLVAATAAVSVIGGLMHHTSIDADAMTASLQQLGKTGAVTGEITRAFGDNLSDLKDIVDKSGNGFEMFGLKFHLGFSHFTTSGATFEENAKKITSVDDALAGLVRSGNAADALQAYNQITQAAQQQGIDLETLASRFPEYSGAVRASADSAEEAGNGFDKFNNRVDASGQAMQSAADAAKAYNDALHALADPLFAMNSAVQSLKEKQKAAADAVAKYGKNSRQARQANLELASAALDVSAAATTLKAKVADGSVSLADAKNKLDLWVRSGLITESQAKNIAGSFDNLIGKANHLGHTDPTVTVHADTAQARAGLFGVLSDLGKLHDKTVHVHVFGLDIPAGPTPPKRKHKETHAGGGWIGPEGGYGGYGEFVVNRRDAAANASLLEAVNRGVRPQAVPAQRYSGGMAGGAPSKQYLGDINLYYPEPEKASEVVPRIERDRAIRSGAGWN